MLCKSLLAVPETLEIEDPAWQLANLEVCWELAELEADWPGKELPDTHAVSGQKLMRGVIEVPGDDPLLLVQGLLQIYGPALSKVLVAADDDVMLGDVTTGVSTALDLSDEYALKSYTFTAAVAATRISIPAGDTVYFCLMQSEALTIPTYPVLVEGAAASVVRSDWTAPVADGVNFSQAAGTVTVAWTAGFDSSAIPNSGGIAILSTTTGQNLLYLIRSAAGALSIRTFDGTSSITLLIPEFSNGDTITFKSTWSKSRNKLNVYASTAGWGTAAAYDGAFTLGSYWYIGYGSAYPFSIKDITVTNTFDKAGL